MPALFTGPFLGCLSKQYLGYEAEDLHRFAALYYWYKNTHGKVTQHSFPALPISYPPNSVSSNTLEENTRNKRALESMLRAQMTNEEFLASYKEHKGFKGVQLHKTTPNLDDDTRNTLMSHIAGYHEPRNEELLTELREAGEWGTEGSDADAKKATFIALQKQLNAKSAAQPSWQECLDRMKLEVVDEPSSLSKLPFKILFRGVELLP
ncbi:hypothetical protein KC318_g83 [Hortaea werneckii]|nr:hypothetical protein KC334_g74 [Hortaea werneckii]KAI7028069.1 hypothetical protein KC355_g82 [Hortaea werneckii]KAI7676729.1 hypothetical protein KC318_g83 [Hortaea werneckii]